MKVLVVGSGGFIGNRLVASLRGKNIDVFGVSSSDGSGINPSTGLLPRNFSIPPEAEAVIYLAQSPYYHQAPGMVGHVMAVNVLSAVHVAELGRRAGVKRFIYASTGNVYQAGFSAFSEDAPLRRDNWYSLSKVHAEEALSLFKGDIDITVVRLFGVYGPGQSRRLVPNLIKSVLEDREIIIERNPMDDNDLDGLKISLCYIDDVVDILHRLIYANRIDRINLASNQVLSIRSIATSIGRRLPREPVFKYADGTRKSDLIADISVLMRTLSPKFVSFEVGIEATIAQVMVEKTSI